MKRVLIVDDDLRHDKMMGYLLLSKGFDVSYAVSGPEALTQLTKEGSRVPDVILMDIMMPEMDGFEVIKEIRARPDLKNVPVIMLTAISDPHNIEKAKAAGAADYIEKPFSPADVLSRINRVIERSDK